MVLLAYVLIEGWPRLDADLFGTRRPSSTPPLRGQAAILGTLWLMAGTAIIALPIGVLAAVYLEEYADRERWYNRLIELNIQNLAAVPSVVYGILGLGLIVRGPLSLGWCPAAGAIILALLILPVIIISSRRRFARCRTHCATARSRWAPPDGRPSGGQSCPTASRESPPDRSWRCRERSARRPADHHRVAGFLTFNPASMFDRFTALPIQIYSYASRPQEEFIVLASALIVVLLVILLAMNSVAIFIRNKYQRRW